MFVISILLLFIVQTYFQEQIEYSDDYKEDVCVITHFHFKRVLFNCWTDVGNVNEVMLPCVEVFVDTTSNTSNYKHLRFYRNIQEKLIIKMNNIQNCSYVPTACENHPNYLKQRLEESLLELFPPIGFKFDCFVSTHRNKHCKNYKQEGFHPKYSQLLMYSNSEALLYLPRKFEYTFCLVVVIFGIILSAIMIAVFFTLDLIENNRKGNNQGNH